MQATRRGVVKPIRYPAAGPAAVQAGKVRKRDIKATLMT
jgi:hypothetical protein